MPPRNSELPEGTDHIIQGAARTRSTDTETGFVGGANRGDDTGGAASGDFGAATQRLKAQVRDSAQSLKGQAGEKVREYAVDGKGRAVGALDEFSRAVNEAAGSIDEKLGAEYGKYARSAADAVSGLADSLRNKEVDELYDDARNLVRKSPAVAIGIAAAVGFAVVRLVKAGLEDAKQDEEGAPPRVTSAKTTKSTEA